MTTDPTALTRLELRLREKYVSALHGAVGPGFHGASVAAFIEGLPLDSPADWPHIVALCGSTRFWAELQEVNARETAAGHIVLAPACDLKRSHFLWSTPAKAEELKPKLDALHRQKIFLADEVVVVSPGGYIGTSTRAEIAYAEKIGRPVRYSHQPATAPAAPCRDLAPRAATTAADPNTDGA